MSKENNTDKKNENSGNGNDHETVTIHIGKKEEKSPNPTTGQALYTLGNVDAELLDLFREIPGKGDDVLISNDLTSIQLKNGDHFYTAQKTLNPGNNG